MDLVARLIATGLFSGYLPFSPGTAGSAVGLVLYWFIPGSESILGSVAIVPLFFLGVWAAKRVDMATHSHDNQQTVIDEIVGMLITLIFMEKKILWLAIGFILFRLFDIFKPYPVRLAEKFPHGWGVMMDDVAAGLYAAAALRLIHWLAG
ncbi:MAG TPA: phosphatidylglycerophosphatase A [bacterium]